MSRAAEVASAHGYEFLQRLLRGHVSVSHRIPALPRARPAGRSERVPADKIGTRCAHNHPKCCGSSFKGPRTFPKQTLPPFWFCYESRWNPVVLTEFLFEVWCGSQKSKNPKTSGVKSKASQSYEKGCLTPSETKPERATKPQGGTAMPASSSSSRVGQTSDSELGKNAIPQIRRVIWVIQPPGERSAWKMTTTKNSTPCVSWHHKVVCEEETLLNLWFYSNISKQLK